MERVEGMPVRVYCNYSLLDSRWIGEKIEEGKVVDIWGGVDGLNWLKANHPGLVKEIEMNKNDWIEAATAKANSLRNKIQQMNSLTNEVFNSQNINVISNENVFDGSGYAGGLSEAYYKLSLLQREVDEKLLGGNL